MTTPTLRPSVAAAIENELGALGTTRSRLEKNQRHVRRVTAALGAAGVAAVLTAGTLLVVSQPGATTTTPTGTIASGTYTGTATVDLGAMPPGAGAVILDVTCVDGGNIEVPLNGSNADVVSWTCADRKDTVHILDGKLPETGSTFITITADPGTVWTVSAQYATTATSQWAVNENGQTYGVPNKDGLPDLSPALATNGREGYISNHELMSFVGEGTINVYESDGTTVIGQFFIGNS